MSRRAIGQHGEREIDRLAADRRFVANLHPQRIEEHDRIHRLERPALPRGHFGDDPIGHRADQIGRDLHGVHLREEALNLAHGHPARIERQDLVVEAGEAPLVLGDQPRLEGALAIARHVERERAVVGQDRLAARPVAMIRGVLRLGAAGRIAQMMRELAAQRPLDDRFLEPADRRVELLVARAGLGERIDRESRTGLAPRACQASAISVCGA